MTPMRGLYPIVDLDSLGQRGVDPYLLAESVLTARPPLLQLRAKHQAPRAVLELLLRLKPLCAESGTLLFANDRPDLALLAATDGVHVGQDDLPLAAVRQLSPTLKVGVSTHDLTQLEAALSQRPDYVAFGPIFATTSKVGADPALGLGRVAQAAELARAAGIPLVVIGGLTLEVAAEIGKHAAIAAVISDLLGGGSDRAAIAARARAWQSALSG
jgi:thiamine-phosphate pyrophosphorylase